MDEWYCVTDDWGNKQDADRRWQSKFPHSWSNLMNHYPVTIQNHMAAYNDVLNRAGANIRRDAVDKRIVSEVRDCFENGNCIRRIIDSPSFDSPGTHLSRLDYSKYSIAATSKDITDDGYPVLNNGIVPEDTDNDGMPDDWETQKGLDPKKDDSAANNLHETYTNIEVYVNLIVENFYKENNHSKTRLSPPKSIRVKNL
jgi:hypothetical protein